MKIVVFMGLMCLLLTVTAQAVTVWEIRRVCGTDSKSYCPKVGYGEPMKACLNRNITKLVPACKAVMGRINAGESVTLF
jgi:hypothetical protein